MDKSRSFLNVSVSIFSRILLLIVGVVVRRLLIRHIGSDVNGLNSLYMSIIGMLSTAELGIGAAITYSMYKPIVERDKRQVVALYCLHKRLYLIIGAVIFLVGLFVTPFLPHVIRDYECLNVNVYLTFLLFLVSTVLTYFYGAKSSLIIAHKDDFITTGIFTIGRFIGYALQILSILLFRSFTLFLGCQTIQSILIWEMTWYTVRERHGEIVSGLEELDRAQRQEVTRNVKAMCMHRIGDGLVYSIDSVIISAFIGVVVLGKYSNYSQIASVLASILTLFFSPLTSVVGHMSAGGDRRRIKEAYSFFYCLNYILGVIFFLGYYAVIEFLVQRLFGAGLEMSRSVSFVITLNGFTNFTRKATILFRNASGVFYHDRWKPVVEGCVNLILSILFVYIFPDEMRVVGVILATIITTLLICDIVEPYVLFKYVFDESVKRFVMRNYLLTFLFTGALFGLTFLLQPTDNAIMGFLVNGLTSVVVSVGLLFLVSMMDREFRKEIRIICGNANAVIRRGSSS